MKTRTGLLPLLSILLAAAAPVHAGVNLWTPFGPSLTGIHAFAFQPGEGGGSSALYVLAPEPFVTRDGGASWAWTGSGLPRTASWGHPVALADDPAVRGALYVSNLAGDVYRSLDAGRHWSFQGSIGDGSVKDLAAMDGTLYAATTTGLFRSPDGGRTWSRTGFTSPVEAVVPDPVSSGTLYAAGEGVFKSGDRGETWSLLLDASIETLAVSADSSALYAGDPDGNVWASADRGATWEKAHASDEVVSSLAVDAGRPSRVYAFASGVVTLSDDGGATWYAALHGLVSKGLVAVDSARPERVYALFNNMGLIASADRGNSWSIPLQRGLGFPPTALLERYPGEPSTLVLCRTAEICYRSPDGGLTWTAFLYSAALYPVSDLAFEPRNPDYVYVVGRYGFLLRLSDGDVRLLSLDGYRAQGLKSVAVSGRSLIVAGDYGAYRSTDGGRTWKGVLPYILDRATGTVRSIQSLVQDPEDASILYALARERRLDGGSDRHVLYQSLDGGARWRRLLEGAQLLAVDPSRPKTLHAVRGSTLLRSRDRGAAWKVQGTIPAASVQDLAIHPEQPSVLLAATDGDGVLLSRDGGHVWVPYNAGLADPGLLRIRKVSADPKVPGRFFAIPAGSELPPSGGVFEVTVD